MNGVNETKENSTLLIAVDGGATKTDLILFHPDGTVVKRIIGGPSNSSEIGFERSTETLRDLFRQLLDNRDGTRPVVLAVFAGLAGGGIASNKTRYKRFLEQLFPQSFVGNGSDAICAINCGLRTSDGMVLIAGTGSSLFVRSRGQIHQIGGWGHLLSDEGSGYDIGRLGLRRVLQALDGRKPETLMTDLFARAIGQPVDRAIPEIYEGGKRYISALSRWVFQAADAGDVAAQEILRTAAHELVQMLISGSRLLPDPPYHVVFSGGLWTVNDGLLKRLVLSELDDAYLPISPEFSPVYGSALEAMKLAGLTLPADFDVTFRLTLPARAAFAEA